MIDEKVLEVQKWLNVTYKDNASWVIIDEDGYTGAGTVKGLIRALQIELNTTADGIMGKGTKNLFNTRFPNGLSEQTYSSSTDENIVYIIQGGFYCRGIDPVTFDGYFGEPLTEAVEIMQEQIGLENLTGVVNAKIIEAILTTDAFTLIVNGSEEIRSIQKNLNKKYGEHLDKYIPTNGIYERQTNKAFIIAIQVEVGTTVDGIWGDNTMNKCPTLMVGSTNRNMIYLLQYLVFCNGYNPNGFDGLYGNGLKNAVTQFQEFCMLDADGICGKQTWASLVVSCGDRNRETNACDTRFEITSDRAKLLKKNGYIFVGRYLTGGDFKELREGEAERILEEGLQLFPIFQENARQASDFSYAKGKQDAESALYAAREKGMPNRTTIYFAVDYDAIDQEVTEHIIPYFQGVKEILQDTEYKVGIYGARNICRRVSENNLASSSFVSDMSTGFSGNIGYKLPSNWNFDQISNITSLDSAYGSLEIDKDVYRAIAETVYRTTINGKTHNQLVNLYNCAVEVNNNDNILSANRNVLDFLRGKYTGGKWDVVAGTPNSTYINKVKNDYPTLQVENIQTDCRDVKMGIDHFALSAKVCINPLPGIVAEIKDYSSWAGDLVQLAAEMQKVYQQNNHIFTEEEIYNLIGCNDDAYAVSLGFSDAESSGFSLEDFYQDLDAYIFANKLGEEKIYDIYRDLYLKENYSNTNRANLFYEYLNKDGYSGTKYQILYAIAYYYTHKPPIFGNIFEEMFGYFDENLWGDKLAKAFAKKITDMME